MNPSNDSRGHDSNVGLIQQNANDSQHFVQADLAYAESNNSGMEAKPKKKKKKKAKKKADGGIEPLEDSALQQQQRNLETQLQMPPAEQPEEFEFSMIGGGAPPAQPKNRQNMFNPLQESKNSDALRQSLNNREVPADMSTTMQGFTGSIKKKNFKLPADEQNNVSSK